MVNMIVNDIEKIATVDKANMLDGLADFQSKSKSLLR